MAKIEDAKGRDPSTGPSGYERLFGVPALGVLLSKCQAAVISSGNELEDILARKITNTNGIAIGDINKEKRTFKNARRDPNGKYHDIRVDVVIERNGKIDLIELKDGDVFDVKKIAGEIQSLNLVREFLISQNSYSKENIQIHFCSFNQDNKDQIYLGAKNLLPKGAAMTGRELCAQLGLNYDEIIEERKKDQPANLDYFLKEILKIELVKKKIEEMLKASNSKS